MGETIEFHCSNCGYTKRFMIGIGYYHVEHHFLKIIQNYPEKEFVSLVLQEKNADVKILNEQIFRCNCCNALYEKLFFVIDYDDKETYLSEYYCDYCGEKLERLKDIEKLDKIFLLDEQESYAKIFCPQCKKEILYYNAHFEWC